MGRILIIALIAVFLTPAAVFADEKQDKQAILEELGSYADKDASILNGAIFSMGDAYLRENKIDSAVALYEKALNILPNNEDLLNRAGNLYSQKMNYDKAIAIYKKLTEMKPDNSWYFQMLSTALNAAGKKEEAGKIWKDLIAKKGEDSNMLNQAANFYANLNDMESAIPLAEKAAKLDANNVGYMQNLAGLYSRAGKFDKAEEAYKNIVSVAKDQWLKDWANGELLNIYQKQNKLDDLASKIEVDLAKTPNDIGLLKQLGELFIRKGDNAKALPIFQKAIKISSDDRNINNRLIDLYEWQGNFTEAAMQMENLVKIAPNEPYLLERLANLYGKADRKEEAKKTWAILTSKVTNDAGLYSRCAEGLYKLGDIAGAVDQLKKAQAMDAGNLSYTLRSASMLIDAGKIEEAKVALGKITVDAKEDWMKDEAKKKLEEIINMKEAPAASVKQEAKPVAVEAKPAAKKEEPKKKKGFLGR